MVQFIVFFPSSSLFVSESLAKCVWVYARSTHMHKHRIVLLFLSNIDLFMLCMRSASRDLKSTSKNEIVWIDWVGMYTSALLLCFALYKWLLRVFVVKLSVFSGCPNQFLPLCMFFSCLCVLTLSFCHRYNRTNLAVQFFGATNFASANEYYAQHIVCSWIPITATMWSFELFAIRLSSQWSAQFLALFRIAATIVTIWNRTWFRQSVDCDDYVPACAYVCVCKYECEFIIFLYAFFLSLSLDFLLFRFSIDFISLNFY